MSRDSRHSGNKTGQKKDLMWLCAERIPDIDIPLPIGYRYVPDESGDGFSITGIADSRDDATVTNVTEDMIESLRDIPYEQRELK
jgi:hypothetical protein